MQINSNRDINKDRKKLTPPEPGKAEGVAHDTLKIVKSKDEPKIVIPTVRHDLKIFTEKQNDEKLATKFLMVGAGLIDYHFW